MKKFALGITAAVLLTGGVSAQNITEQNVARTQEIIAGVLEAYGGAERLASLNSIVIEHQTTATAVGQSRAPGPPWDRNNNQGQDAIQFDDSIFVTGTSGTGGGFEFDNTTIINAEQSYQLNHRAGTATPISQADFNTASGPFIRVTPALLVRQLNLRANTARYLGDAEVDGRSHAVISFVMQTGPAISLYFDQESYRLNKSERVLPGFGLIEYRFYDYDNIAGIPFNQRFELLVNGDTNLERRNTSTQVNSDITALTQVPESLSRLAAIDPDPLTTQKLGEGVYLIGGSGTYAMFIEMDDYVIAVGGAAGIPQRISELRKVIATKPIRYGVMTHHHSDHVLGVPAYAAEGATVIASNAHASVVRAAATGDVELKLETVETRRVLEDADRRVEIIDIGPTAHTEHLLVTYLPAEGLLFEADHFTMPRNGVVPPAVSSTRSFAGALARHQLEIKTLVSAHSPLTGTPQDLQTALDKPVVR